MRIYSELEYEGLMLRGFHDKVNDDVVAIITHGIGGNKLGHKFIFKQFADYANENNISVLRYDFAGTGESDGDFANTRHSAQVNQVELFINEAINLGYKKIILCSTTIGCYSVWHASNTSKVKAYVNWNPICNYNRYEANNTKHLTSDGGIDMKGLFLNATYPNDLATLDREIPKLDKPVLILQGELDGEYKYDDTRNTCDEYGWHYKSVENGNHLWEGNEVREQLFSETVKFIKNNI